MNQLEVSVIDAVVSAAVDAANKMCNPDVWKFEYDWLDSENIVLNVRMVGGFSAVSDVEDAVGYCCDLGDVIEKLLLEHSKKEWVKHSEHWYWGKDGNEIENEPETNADARLIDCVQHQFYPVED